MVRGLTESGWLARMALRLTEGGWLARMARGLAEGGWRAVIFPRQGSGILSSLVEADGLVELPEDLTRIERGAMVDFLPFSEVT